MSRSPLRRRAGAQSLAELALLMPFLALLFIGLIELGFFLHAHVQVSSATREAARAASLYASTRYAAFTDQQLGNLNSPPTCTSGIPGWSLLTTVEQAVVSNDLDKDGCPDAGGAVTSSALGFLNPAQASANSYACPPSSDDGWDVALSPAFNQSGDAMPPRGSQATITLCYPYRLIIAAQLFNYYGDPVWITKSVVFHYQ